MVILLLCDCCEVGLVGGFIFEVFVMMINCCDVFVILGMGVVSLFVLFVWVVVLVIV